jgi:tetratricopeptide (TPR) repeat protein
MAQAWFLYARGVAQAREGRVIEAAATLEALKPVAAQTREKNLKRKRTVSMMDYMVARLESEVAQSRGDADAAIAAFAKAADAAVDADDNEPPMLGDMARVMLGDLQARARHWADAESSYRRALADRPGHPLAQRGLREALAAQGKS